MQDDQRFLTAEAAAEAPRSLAWAAALVVAMSLLNAGFYHLSVEADLLHALAALTLGTGALVARTHALPARAMPALVATCAVVLVLAVQIEVSLDPSHLGMAYLLVLLTGFGPFVLSLRAYLVSAVLLAPGQFLVSGMLGDDDRLAWLSIALAALVAGGVTLRLRCDSVVRQGEASDLAASLASNDQLTGALNRRGLDSCIDALFAAAARRSEPVMAVFIDVDGLKRANDGGGHVYGDRILEAVAAAVRSATRTEDLVCRWGGDEFLVIGTGRAPALTDLEQRISSDPGVVAATGPLWHGTVSVGAASLPAGEATLDALIHAADHDMYRRRERQAS